jgi:hypothetical protein
MTARKIGTLNNCRGLATGNGMIERVIEMECAKQVPGVTGDTVGLENVASSSLRCEKESGNERLPFRRPGLLRRRG